MQRLILLLALIITMPTLFANNDQTTVRDLSPDEAQAERQLDPRVKNGNLDLEEDAPEMEEDVSRGMEFDEDVLGKEEVPVE